MSIAKLVSFLTDESLYFTRLDKLADEYEGAVCRMGPPSPDLGMTAEDFVKFRDVAGSWRNTTAINSWSVGENESYAMWRVFAGDEGVAVQSTFGDLILSLDSRFPEPTYVGLVHYYDETTQYFPGDNAFLPSLHKREYFRYENELRAVYYHPLLNVDHGALMPVDIRRLIKSVFISPLAAPWLVAVVESLMKMKGISVPVCMSRLTSKPSM